MELTADLYEQVIRAIRPGPRRTNDARRLARVGVAFRLTLKRGRTPAAGASIVVRLRDLSPTGVGLIASQPLKYGERIVAQLPRAAELPLEILGEVRFCTQVEERLWHLGVHFVADNQGTDYTRRAIDVRNAVPT